MQIEQIREKLDNIMDAIPEEEFESVAKDFEFINGQLSNDTNGIEEDIREFIADNYGNGEAESPCYDLFLMARHLKMKGALKAETAKFEGDYVIGVEGYNNLFIADGETRQEAIDKVLSDLDLEQDAVESVMPAIIQNQDCAKVTAVNALVTYLKNYIPEETEYQSNTDQDILQLISQLEQA